jgi:DNA-binding IclR family transcriptional regulator
MADSADSGNDRTAVFRTVAIIDALTRAEPHGIGVRELAAATAISRSAAHRVLSSLTQLGYARQLPNERYEAGTLALAWAAVVGDSLGLPEAAQIALEQITEQFDETAYAAEYDADRGLIVFRAVAHSSKPVRYELPLDSTGPLHAGAAGKAVLAYLPDSEVDRVELHRFGKQTITDRRRLRVELGTVRTAGLAWSFGERISEAVGCAAPVFRGEDVAGSITMSIPAYRFDDERRDEIGAAVIAAAHVVTGLLTASHTRSGWPSEPRTG